ncbi:MAG: hypothetical protein L3J67_12665 [Hyphomicrobiaceae bacterium]|nr:hypothetical protein [Hyphomicrobiaceae bacterium]
MRVSIIILTFFLAGCTGGHISPQMEIEGVGKVFQYTGKANFGYQKAEALRMMADHCHGVNGGRPVIVSIGKGDRGFVRMGNQYIRNRSQSIFYKCKK